MIRLLSPAFGLLLVIVTKLSCRTPQPPLYRSIENWRVGKVDLGETVVSADVRYYNPNNYRLEMKHAEVAVYINNQFMGESILDSIIIIPKKDSFLLPVSMRLNLKQVFANALYILLTGEVSVKLDGFAKLGKGILFIDVPIHYEGKQRIALDKF